METKVINVRKCLVARAKTLAQGHEQGCSRQRGATQRGATRIKRSIHVFVSIGAFVFSLMIPFLLYVLFCLDAKRTKKVKA